MDGSDKPVVFKIRLYPGPDDDLIAWLQGIEGPRGAKSAAIKSIWRAGIHKADHDPGLDQDQRAALLADIRKVVEAAVSGSIGQKGCGSLVSGQSLPEVRDDEAEQILLAMDEGMLLSTE